MIKLMNHHNRNRLDYGRRGSFKFKGNANFLPKSLILYLTEKPLSLLGCSYFRETIVLSEEFSRVK